MLLPYDRQTRQVPMLAARLWLGSALLIVGCAEGGEMGPDAFMMGDAGAPEGGAGDAGVDGAADAGIPDATARDADTMDASSGDAEPDSGAMDAAAMDASPPDATGPPCTVAPGFVYINEIMIASVSGSRDRGEWFEIYNPGDCEADLSGMVIASPTSSGTMREHTISSLRIAPGSYTVLAQSLNPAEHHGANVDYAYGTGSSTTEIRFSNSRDSLLLRAGMDEIDRIEWTSSGFSYSTSRQFPTSGAISEHGTWSRWCDSTQTFSMTGGVFYGTPGMANDMTCP